MIKYDENYFETENEKKLFRMLKAIRDSYDFVVGVMVQLRHDNKGIAELIKWLEMSKETNCGNITEQAAIIAGDPIFLPLDDDNE